MRDNSAREQVVGALRAARQQPPETDEAAADSLLSRLGVTRADVDLPVGDLITARGLAIVLSAIAAVIALSGLAYASRQIAILKAEFNMTGRSPLLVIPQSVNTFMLFCAIVLVAAPFAAAARDARRACVCTLITTVLVILLGYQAVTYVGPSYAAALIPTVLSSGTNVPFVVFTVLFTCLAFAVTTTRASLSQELIQQFKHSLARSITDMRRLKHWRST